MTPIPHEGNLLTWPQALELATSYETEARRHTRDKEHTLAADLRSKLADLTNEWSVVR